VFVRETPVRFGDTDAMGHVNNATFLTYLEDARVGFFTGAPGGLVGLAGLILARTEIDFVAPARFGTGPVRTTTWVEHVGTKSFRMGYTMEQDGAVVARATSVQVAYDYAAGASRPLTDEERAALEPYVREAPGV
jgi:acyl-CoA thioester hydrolase